MSVRDTGNMTHEDTIDTGVADRAFHLLTSAARDIGRGGYLLRLGGAHDADVRASLAEAVGYEAAS